MSIYPQTKRLSISLLFVFSTIICTAQIKAITEKGDEVILRQDGTWSYTDSKTENTTPIDTNRISFKKNDKAGFQVKSNKVSCGVYIDPKKWSFSKNKGDDASEMSFTLKEKDGYAMLITEKIEIPFETLKMAALSNAREVAPDVSIVKEEYRKVNDKFVLMLQMSGTLSGIRFTYLGYYYSSPNGTVQLITYTASNLFNEYAADLEDFLNGFVITD